MHQKYSRITVAIIATLSLSITAITAPSIAYGEAEPPRRLQPAWSPDGKAIAFLENNGGQIDIRIYDFDKDKARTVRTNVGHSGYPAFAPSGDKLVFPLAAKDGNGPWRIITLDLETGKEREIMRSENRIMHAQWSPDGRFVSYIEFDGAAWTTPNDIRLLNMETGDIQRVTKTPEITEFHPKWRSDSAALIFDSSDAEAIRIVQKELASGTETELSRIERPEIGGAPSFAPDGKIAVFGRERGEKDGVWIVNIETGDARLLFANDNARSSSGAVFSPDGQRVAFHSAAEDRFDLYIINRDGSGLSLLINN